MNLDCSICMEPTDIVQGHGCKYGPKRSLGVILGCSHVFHRKCIKKWYKSVYEGNTCPCCRGKIKFTESSLYNRLIIDFEYVRDLLPMLSSGPELLHDGFLYYDNAILLLYVCDVLTNSKHFCKTSLTFFFT